MSIYKLDIYNAVNAYSKQISLSSLVQKKKVVISLKSVDDEAGAEDGEEQVGDVDQEIEETEKN